MSEENDLGKRVVHVPNELGLNDSILWALRKDICPDCDHVGLRGGPRGGEGQNIFCDACGAGFNVAYPRYIFWAERIRQGKKL